MKKKNIIKTLLFLHFFYFTNKRTWNLICVLSDSHERLFTAAEFSRKLDTIISVKQTHSKSTFHDHIKMHIIPSWVVKVVKNNPRHNLQLKTYICFYSAGCTIHQLPTNIYHHVSLILWLWRNFLFHGSFTSYFMAILSKVTSPLHTHKHHAL